MSKPAGGCSDSVPGPGDCPKKLLFRGPRPLGVVPDGSLSRPREPDEGRVRALCSGVSAGTELLLYRGQIVADDALDATIAAYKDPDAGRREHRSLYPTTFGYCLWGEVVAVGSGLDRERWVGSVVFLLAGHAEEHIVKVSDVLFFADDWNGATRELVLAVPQLIPVSETVTCWLQDAAPVLGDRVAVVGAGLYGSVLAVGGALLFPLSTWLVVEPDAKRRAQLAVALKEASVTRCQTLAPDQVQAYLSSSSSSETRFDIVLEVSGTTAGLNVALELVRATGRVIIGSWYGRKAQEVPVEMLGSTRLHRSHAQILFSQVSEIPPWLAGRYDKRRRLTVVQEFLTTFSSAFKAIACTVRSFAFEEAPYVFGQLDNGALSDPVRFLYGDSSSAFS
jgi:NADPH:quinone reductase-like Zn-dependent oxidoreductase